MSAQKWQGGSSQALSAAMTLTVTLIGFTFGGYALDGWLETGPLFLIVGVILGAIGGFIHLLQALAPEVLPWGKKPEPPADGRSTDSNDDRPSDPD